MVSDKERRCLWRMSQVCIAEPTYTFHFLGMPFRIVPHDEEYFNVTTSEVTIQVRKMQDLADAFVKLSNHRKADDYGQAPRTQMKLRHPIQHAPHKVSHSAYEDLKHQVDAIKPTHGHLFSHSPSPSPGNSRRASNFDKDAHLISALKSPDHPDGGPSPSRVPSPHIHAQSNFDEDDIEELNTRLATAAQMAYENRGVENPNVKWKTNASVAEGRDTPDLPPGHEQHEDEDQYASEDEQTGGTHPIPEDDEAHAEEVSHPKEAPHQASTAHIHYSITPTAAEAALGSHSSNSTRV